MTLLASACHSPDSESLAVLDEATASESVGLRSGPLLFSDEFNANTLSHRTGFRPVRVDQGPIYWEPNGGKWKSDAYVHGCDPNTSCELQYYTRYDLNYAANGPENYLIVGHQSNFEPSTTTQSLKLITRHEPDTKSWLPGWMGNQGSPSHPWNADGSNFYSYFDYTSGWIESSPAFKYGRFEVRAKIPNQGRVIWPAFWLFGGSSYEAGGRSIGGEKATEIDIFEFTGYNANVYTRNIHSYHELDYYIAHYGQPSQNPNLISCTPNWSPNCNYHADASANSITLHQGFEQAMPAIDLGQYHTYAVEWAPRKLTFYFDGAVISSRSSRDIPSNFMRVILNMAIPQWLGHGVNSGYPGSDVGFPSTFEIDYVRVNALPNKDFVPEWTNAGSDRMNWFFQNPNDRYFTANFDGDPAEEVLALNDGTGHAHLMKYAPAKQIDTGWQWEYQTPTWSTPWSTGSDQIGSFYLNSNDLYVTGNFVKETSGPAKDEFLAFNAGTKYAMLMSYAAGAWSTPWWTSGGIVHWWYFNFDDRYVAGDFDGDGQDELLAVNNTSRHAHLMKYSAAGWNTPWATGSGSIHGWVIGSQDKFLAGDFDGDGRDEVLAINATTGRAHLLKYNAGTWSTPWQTNSGIMHWWYLNADDQYTVADFDGDGKDELLTNRNASGYSHLMAFGAGATTITTIWSNDGLGYSHAPDFLLAGDFEGDGSAESLVISAAHWAALLKYKQPGQVLSF